MQLLITINNYGIPADLKAIFHTCMVDDGMKGDCCKKERFVDF